MGCRSTSSSKNLKSQLRTKCLAPVIARCMVPTLHLAGCLTCRWAQEATSKCQKATMSSMTWQVLRASCSRRSKNLLNIEAVLTLNGNTAGGRATKRSIARVARSMLERSIKVVPTVQGLSDSTQATGRSTRKSITITRVDSTSQRCPSGRQSTMARGLSNAADLNGRARRETVPRPKNSTETTKATFSTSRRHQRVS